ncbi:MAG: hypothetical protein AAGA93_00715 [Actinomycetota bacterium]
MLKSGRWRDDARGRLAPAVLGLMLIVSVIGFGSAGPASASGKGPRLSGAVTFDDGAPAAGVTIDLFVAADRWTRGHYVGSVSSGANGRYRFDVDTGCYIAVAIAPAGSEFDAAGSGRTYDQQHGCADEGAPQFASVLYRTDPQPHPDPDPRPDPKPDPDPRPDPDPKPDPDPLNCVPAHASWILRPEVGRLDYSLELNTSTFGRQPLDIDLDAIEATVPGVDFGPSDDAVIVFPPILVTERFGVIRNLRSTDIPLEVVTTVTTQSGPQRVKLCFEIETISPIGLDLDGSGVVERVTGEFSFDFDADGEVEVVSEWFAPTEGILLDTRIEGPVTGEHLFGDQGGVYADGFEKLARLDANGDGWIAGAEADGLAIWTDVDGDAVLDAGEHATLASHGVEALSVSHRGFVSEARLVDGSMMVTEDLWFPVATASSGADTIRVAVLAVGGIALLGVAGAAGRRRRRSFGEELDELLAAGRT